MYTNILMSFWPAIAVVLSIILVILTIAGLIK